MSGTASIGQSTSWSGWIQILLLVIGLFWASRVTQQISESKKQALPIVAFSGVFTVSMLWLLIG
jgi:hypothetical protein